MATSGDLPVSRDLNRNTPKYIFHNGQFYTFNKAESVYKWSKELNNPIFKANSVSTKLSPSGMEMLDAPNANNSYDNRSQFGPDLTEIEVPVESNSSGISGYPKVIRFQRENQVLDNHLAVSADNGHYKALQPYRIPVRNKLSYLDTPMNREQSSAVNDNVINGQIQEVRAEESGDSNTVKDWNPPGLWGYIKQGASDVWDKNAPKSWKLAGEQLKQESKALVNRNQDIIEQAKVEGKHIHKALKKGVRNAFYGRQVIRDIATAALAEQLRRKAIAEGRDASKYPSFWQVMKENYKEGVPKHQLMDLMIQNGIDWRLAFGIDALDKVLNSDETVAKGLINEPEKTVPAAIKGFTAIHQLPFTAAKAVTAQVNRYTDKAFGNFNPETSPSWWDIVLDDYNPYKSPKYQLHTQLLKAMTRPKGSEGMPRVWYDRLPLEWKRKIAETPGLLIELYEAVDDTRDLKNLVKGLPTLMKARVPGLDFADDAVGWVKKHASKVIDSDDFSKGAKYADDVFSSGRSLSKGNTNSTKFITEAADNIPAAGRRDYSDAIKVFDDAVAQGDLKKARDMMMKDVGFRRRFRDVTGLPEPRKTGDVVPLLEFWDKNRRKLPAGKLLADAADDIPSGKTRKLITSADELEPGNLRKLVDSADEAPSAKLLRQADDIPDGAGSRVSSKIRHFDEVLERGDLKKARDMMMRDADYRRRFSEVADLPEPRKPGEVVPLLEEFDRSRTSLAQGRMLANAADDVPGSLRRLISDGDGVNPSMAALPPERVHGLPGAASGEIAEKFRLFDNAIENGDLPLVYDQMMKDVDFRRYFSQKTGTPLVQKPADLIPTLREYSIRSQHPSIALGESIEMVRPGRIGSDFVDHSNDLLNHKAGRIVNADDALRIKNRLENVNQAEIKYLADGRRVPSTRRHKIKRLDELVVSEPIPIQVKTRTKGPDDKLITSSFNLHVLYDGNGKMPDVSMLQNLDNLLPADAIADVDDVFIVASTVERLDGSVAPIRGWINVEAGKKEICVFTYIEDTIIDPKTGKAVISSTTNKPLTMETPVGRQEQLNTFFHETGHNVSFKSEAYKLQEENFKAAHNLLLEYEGYDDLFGGSKYFRDYDEFFAETFRYAVKDHRLLIDMDNFLLEMARNNNIQLDFTLTSLFHELLR